MPMDSGEPIALEMFKGDPIALMSLQEINHMHEAEVVDIEESSTQAKQD